MLQGDHPGALMMREMRDWQALVRGRVYGLAVCGMCNMHGGMQ